MKCWKMERCNCLTDLKQGSIYAADHGEMVVITYPSWGYTSYYCCIPSSPALLKLFLALPSLHPSTFHVFTLLCDIFTCFINVWVHTAHYFGPKPIYAPSQKRVLWLAWNNNQQHYISWTAHHILVKSACGPCGFHFISLFYLLFRNWGISTK